jgi:hypothetical protein
MDNDGEIVNKITNSERSHIDKQYFGNNNTFIERKMIEIMELMWDHNPKDRPTIFEVIAFLTNVQDNFREQGIDTPADDNTNRS